MSILTCANEGISLDEFQNAWRAISEQSPPDTCVMAVYAHNGKKPIHDRWIISRSAGLRLGTSLNSLGNKLSEISVMRDHECSSCEAELDKYFLRQAVVGGSRIKSVSFDL